MGGGCKSKVEDSNRVNNRRQNTSLSGLSRLDSNTIVDKLRLHRKNIPEDMNDGMKEQDFVQLMVSGIQRRYDTNNLSGVKRSDSKRSINSHTTLAKPVNFQWEEVRELGRGSFGSVVLGKKVKTGQLMAVKKLMINDKQASADAMTEITLLSNMKQNPFIVNLIGYQEKNDMMYIFMEYVEGGSIESQLQKYRKDGQVMEKLVSKYTYQILKGLNFLHENRGIAQQGANILTDRMGCCKLADFGSAQKVVGPAETTKIFGTVCWMAPEIIKQSGFDFRSDIWSLGATVFEMLTSFPPFFDKNANQWTIMHKIAGTDELPYLGENISSIAKEFVYTCMKRNPDERPSAKSLLEHPFVLRYSKNLDQAGKEIEPIESITKQSPEDEFNAAQLLKQGKELRGLDIKQEILNIKGSNTGSRSSIRKNDGFQLSVQTAESKGNNFFPNSKPTTPANLHQLTSSFRIQDTKTLDNEKYINIDSSLKLSSNHSIIDTNKSKIDDRGQPRDQVKGKCLPSLGGMITRHAPHLPKYDGALSMVFKGLGQLNAKKNMDQSGSGRSKGPLNNALASLINNNKRNRTSIDVFNISTFPKGYNLDETVAQLEKSCVEDDQQDSKNELLPTNLLDAIIEKPKRSSQYLGNSTIHKPSESYF